MIGKTISHYKILEKLGSGGMGVVYKAQDTKLERFVALKFLPYHVSQDEENKKRFILEAKAASALNHPNIATIYEIDETDGEMFIAMEYIDGESLQARIARDLLPIDEALTIVRQIAEGLSKAHTKKIIHRDIKPANILIAEDGQVKIVDFGLAKLAGRTLLTQEGMILGTVAYMSPEQTQGIAVDHRTDIWSLGVVWYEMLTGRLAFRGDYEQAIIYSILNEDPEPLSDLRPEVSAEIEQSIYKALAKETGDRYSSVTELLLDSKKTAIRSEPGGTAPEKIEESEGPSVAVIDFANITREAAVDWLAGGIAESVTVDLQKIAALRVISREKISKVLVKFKKQKLDEDQILDLGSSLGVRWLVWGGFQKMGPAIRITAHFTEISTGNLVGSAKVDGSMEDIFILQDRIITELMDALNLEISDSEFKKIKTPETLELEAYEYYAKGRQLFGQFGKTSFGDARELFEKAIEIDGEYALAYAGLGGIYIFKFIEQTDSRDLDIGISYLQKSIKYDCELSDPYFWLTYAYFRKQEFDQAIKAGIKAVELTPDHFNAHYFLGVAYLAKVTISYELERYPEATQHITRSVALEPNYEASRMILAWIFLLNGNYEGAKEHLERAVAIEESDKFEGVKFVGALTLLGNLYYRQQQMNSAQEWYEKSLDLLEKSDHLYAEPFTALTYCGLGNVELTRRRYDDARRNYKMAIEIIEKNPKALGIGYFATYAHLGMAKAFHKLGMNREATQQLEETLKLFQDRKGYDFSLIWEGSDAQILYDIASYHALLNDRQEALSHLRKAIACGWADVPYWHVDENFSRLRQEVEFQKIVQDLKSREP